jgi:hypothetical protein
VPALVAAGCGSDEAEVPEVPGPPPALTVPHQKGAADLGASPTPTPSGTPTPTATADSGTTGSTGTTGGAGTNAAATATPAPATQDSPTTDTAPPSGSAPEKFEQFCEENAGAC